MEMAISKIKGEMEELAKSAQLAAQKEMTLVAKTFDNIKLLDNDSASFPH